MQVNEPRPEPGAITIDSLAANLDTPPDLDYNSVAHRNIIAREIENVINKLTAQSFNRDAFFEDLRYFYQALEDVASTIHEYGYKQHFLNTVYERFFQGFSVKVADTHGIVYTPQPIVDFMVKSVNEILALQASGVKSLLIVSHLPLVGYIVGELTPAAGVPAFATSSIGHVELDENGFAFMHSLTSVQQVKAMA